MMKRIRRRIHVQWISALWLAVVWMLLWGDPSLGNLIVGVLLGVVVQLIFPMPPVDFVGRIHLGPLLVLVGRFIIDLFIASAQVARLALYPGRCHPQGAVIAVYMRSTSDLYMTLTAEFVSLVPGSLIVETQRRSGVMYVHVLNVSGPEGVEEARRSVEEQEERVLRALASYEELRAAGLEPRTRWEQRAAEREFAMRAKRRQVREKQIEKKRAAENQRAKEEAP